MQDRNRIWMLLLAIFLFMFFSICVHVIQPDRYIIDYRQPVYKLFDFNTSMVYSWESLSPGDYYKLVDLHNFSFTTLNEICEDAPPLLLVIIHSSPHNFAHRKTIRETWGAVRDGVRIAFMLGLVENASTQDVVAIESHLYGDIVQGDFMDTYRNLTYKHVMGLKYSLYHCPQAKYLLKTDDDVFVNTFAMVDFLRRELSPFGATNLLMCRLVVNAVVFRSYRSKWRVSPREYMDGHYPPYCSGFAILYSRDVAFTLYREAQRSDYFWVDDVYVTGILAKKTNVSHTDVSYMVLSTNDFEAVESGDKYFLYGYINIASKDIRKMWDVVSRGKLRNGNAAPTWKSTITV